MSLAAFHAGSWYRVEIAAVGQFEASALFVDLGMVKTVKLTSLRFLDKSFAAPPRMSANGRLFGIKPKNGEKTWSVAAQVAFKSMTQSKMFGSIKAADENSFALTLVHSIEKRIRVEELMILEGHADADTSATHSLNATFMKF